MPTWKRIVQAIRAGYAQTGKRQSLEDIAARLNSQPIDVYIEMAHAADEHGVLPDGIAVETKKINVFLPKKFASRPSRRRRKRSA